MTYDFERLMEGATLVKMLGVRAAIIENLP